MVIYEQMIKEGIKLDHVCFMKLVQGCLNCGRSELAVSFLEKNIRENQVLNPEIYKKVIVELKKNKELDEDKIENIENYAKNSYKL